MTNLKEAFSKIADGIFKIFKSFVVTGGNIVLPAQGYDPSTGDVTGSETLYPISEIIFTSYKLEEIDGEIIRKLDKKALFRGSEIAVDITEQMFLRLSGGDEWNIIDIKLDSATAMYILQCRRP